jgi:cobalt-zinc-cadmium efflux system protein
MARHDAGGHGHDDGHDHGRGRGHVTAERDRDGGSHGHHHGLGPATGRPTSTAPSRSASRSTSPSSSSRRSTAGAPIRSPCSPTPATTSAKSRAGLAWAGAFAGRLAPDERHTYGWKRASILAAFANSLLLLVAIGSLAWAAIGRLAAPAPIAAGTVMVVAAVGIVVNGATALLFLRGSHDDLNARGAFLHMAADAAVSAGVVGAAALTLWLGWTWLDPACSLAIALVILFGTWGLFRDSLHLMFDGVPTSIDLEAVRAELAALPGVACVSDLHVWATGTTRSL